MAMRKTHWLIVVSFLALFGGRLQAANAPDFATVDSVSYRMYVNKDWTALEKYCKQAVKAGFDYYYLRIRWGIAFFEQHNYRGAIPHFEQALRFSENDALANEYLYYSYVYAGYNEKARWLSKSFDAGFATYLHTKKLSPVEFISAESGVKLSDTASYKTGSFSEIAVKHYIGRRMSVFHALGYYRQAEFRFNVQQFQYYVNATLPLKHGWTVFAATHLLYYQAAVNSYTYNEVNVTHAPGGQQGGGPPTRLTTTQVGQTAKNAFTYIGSAGALKQTKNFDLSFGSTVASVDTVVQLQLNAGVSWYPFGNTRLAVGSAVYVHSENLAGGAVSVAVAPFVSAVFTRRLSGSLGYFNNNGVNIAESNGYMVNNSPDFSTERFTASISFALFKKMYIYGVCARENKRELTGAFKYNYNIVMFGIKVIPS